MDNALPLPIEEPPITEKTKAIQQMSAEVNSKLQNLTAEVQAVRTLMEADRANRETWKAAAVRAIKQFLSQITPPERAKERTADEQREHRRSSQ